jgi:hypothetical protein
MKKNCCHTFFCSHKFYKIENYFILEMLKKKIWDSFQRIIELFIQKFVTKLSKIWVWDPGSEIRDPEKTYSGSQISDPGVKKAPDPGSGPATLCMSTVFVFASAYSVYTTRNKNTLHYMGVCVYLFCFSLVVLD